jgi:hypothetical protein
MLDTTTVVEPIYDQEDWDQGHDDDHQLSPQSDLASSVTPLEEHGWTHDRDARGQIENQHREWERDEQELRDLRDHD